jgi:hypothetical protein
MKMPIYVAFLAAALAHAQTTLLATHIAQDPTGTLLPVGKLCVTPIINGYPSGFHAGSNTQVLPRQACTAIRTTSGGLLYGSRLRPKDRRRGQ